MLADLQRHQSGVEDAIDQLVEGCEEIHQAIQIIETIPGCGRITAITVKIRDANCSNQIKLS